MLKITVRSLQWPESKTNSKFGSFHFLKRTALRSGVCRHLTDRHENINFYRDNFPERFSIAVNFNWKDMRYPLNRWRKTKENQISVDTLTLYELKFFFLSIRCLYRRLPWIYTCIFVKNLKYNLMYSKACPRMKYSL